MARAHLSLLRYVRCRTSSQVARGELQPRRGLTTLATLPTHEAQISREPTPPPAVSEHVSTTQSPGDSLFEDFTAEYASFHISNRTQRPFNPAWPSLFPPLVDPTPEEAAPLFSSTGTALPDFFEDYREQVNLNRTSIPCDLLARTILQGNLSLASQIRKELKLAGTPILPRSIYLNTAVRCLRKETFPDRDLGKEECLAWLGLWHSFTPDQAAAKDTLLARNQLRRLAQAALHRHGEDVRFLSELAMLSSRKGVADDVIRHILPYLTYAVPPSTSHQLLEGLICYVQSHGPHNVHDPTRRWYHSNSFFEMVRFWRNIHLKILMRSGQWEDAKAVYKAGLEHDPPVIWARHNRERLAQHMSQPLQDQNAAKVQRQKLADGALGHERLFASRFAPGRQDSLPRRILQVSHMRSSQPLRSLTGILQDLHATHPVPSTLIERLKSRFVYDGMSRKKIGSVASTTHVATETTASFWWSAEIKRLQALGQHQEAVLVFARNFQWFGLPSQSFLSRSCRRELEKIAVAAETQSHDLSTAPAGFNNKVAIQIRPKLLPSSQAIANVLPSLIRLLQRHSSEAVAAYHKHFCEIATSQPPCLKVDSISHLPFIRAYAAHTTAVQLAEYVQSLENQGFPVGHQGWGVVAVALAKDGQISRLHRLLKQLAISDAAAASSVNGGESNRRLVPRTYLGAAITLLRKKNSSKARTVLRAMQQRFPE